MITNPNVLRPLVSTVTGEAVVQRVRGREARQVFLVGGWLSDESNAEWWSWPYFDYFIYRLIAEAGGAPRILSFADYPAAPVPHDSLRLSLTGAGIGVLVGVLMTFFFARRALFLRPELADISLPEPDSPPLLEGWHRAGFHRPLAGLFFLMGGGFLLFVPLLTYHFYFLPVVLVPSRQVLTFWEQAGQWLALVWLFFNAGVSVAVVRYFAVLAPQQPRRGFRYLQFYVWWQFLGTGVQVAAILIFSALLIPQSRLAHLAFYFLAQALIQFPGFLRVFQYLFRGQQRLDYDQLLTLVLVGGPVLFQTLFILLLGGQGRLSGWDANVRVVFGLGGGLLMTEWATFGLGLLLYRRAGYRLQALLSPSFDLRIAGRALGFGLRLLPGLLAPPVGSLLLARVADYEGSVTSWSLVIVLALVYEMLALGLYQPLMPAIATAHAFGYRRLVRHYGGQGLRYGLGLSLLLLALLAAWGEPFLLGVTEGRGTLLSLILPLALWGGVQWLAWSAESVLLGLGYPGLRSGLLVGEQVLRLALATLLGPGYGIRGVLFAFLASSLLRGLVGWYFVQRKGIRVHLSFWQTAVAPAGSALILYNLFLLLGEVFWEPRLEVTLLLIGVSLLLALPGYGFLTAFFGGWDAQTLAELAQALRISGLGWPVAFLMWVGAKYGAQLSPLHGQFATSLPGWAAEEAEALSLLRAPFRGQNLSADRSP